MSRRPSAQTAEKIGPEVKLDDKDIQQRLFTTGESRFTTDTGGFKIVVNDRVFTIFKRNLSIKPKTFQKIADEMNAVIYKYDKTKPVEVYNHHEYYKFNFAWDKDIARIRFVIQTMLGVLGLSVKPRVLRQILLATQSGNDRRAVPQDHQTQEHHDAIEREAAFRKELRDAHEKYKPGGDGYYEARNEYMRLMDVAAAARLLKERGGGIDELINAMESMLIE